MARKYLPPSPTFRVAKLASRRGLFALLAIGLTPLFALMAVWGWYANVGEVEGQTDDPMQNPGSFLATDPAGTTNSVSALPASHAPSRSSAAFSSISLGHDHACGVLTSGKIVCWGRNDRGQATPPDGEFKSVSAGALGSCGIRPNYTVVCWGHGIRRTPNSTFSSVSVYDTACGTTLAGSIVCWSDGSSHQVPADGSFRQVSLGRGHACALRTDATLHCWGRNDHGQANAPTGQFQSVAAGDIHNCGLRADGAVACWGASWHGRTSPPSGTYRQVDTIWDFSCGVRSDGSVACWGINLSGEANPPAGNFEVVETGARFACGLKADATVVCWGSDEDGRTEPPSATEPAPVSNIAVCSGPNAGEVVISWDAVLPATHYRIGYVNITQDYSWVLSTVTKEWTEAFIYVDVNALNVPVGSDDRAQYTLRRLAPGDQHAFTVLTSNNVVNTAQTLSGTYYWPQNSPWQFLTVAAPETDCDDATAAPPPLIPTGDYDVDNDGLVEISNLAQLDAMRHDLDGDGSATHPDHSAAFPDALAGMGCPAAGCIGYELIADLNFDTNASGLADSGDAYWNDGWGWTPIGDPDAAYNWNAVFDGGERTISNLYISWGDTNHVGLFRVTGPDSVVQNVGLEAVTVTGNSSVGGLAGSNSGAISNSFTTGTVTGNGGAVGGLVGNSNGAITSSYSNANVTGKGSFVGGLAGNVLSGVAITDSHATGDVASEGDYVGGLVGITGPGASVTASYATGNVSGKNGIGGLIGNSMSGGAITTSYALGDVTGHYTTKGVRPNPSGRRYQVPVDGKNIGGLAGYANGVTINSCYAAGTVRGAEMVGGLVGTASGSSVHDSYAYGPTSFPYTTSWRGPNGSGGGLIGGSEDTTVANSYWDIQATGLSHSAGGVGKTTRELQSATANTGIYANWNPDWWDFGTSRQYPALKYGGLDVARQRR